MPASSASPVAKGFWGDWLEAPRRQVEGGQVDYLMLDYLAEVTMSIVQKQKERDPRMGYARDFIGAMESVFPAVADRGGQGDRQRRRREPGCVRGRRTRRREQAWRTGQDSCRRRDW